MESVMRRLVVLADHSLDFHHGKTALSIIRYRPHEIVAIIDSDNAGRTAGDVLGFGGDVSIVGNIEEALSYDPGALLLGIAPRGGSLPPEWRRQILTAIAGGLDIISGLHFMLNDDPELVEAAQAAGTKLIDVRRAPEGLRVAELRPRRPEARVITFVGSDCAVGKMTAALEIHEAAQARGLSSAFVATGQTGIMLEGSGIAVDRVIGDFMAGAIEQLAIDAAARADWVFVEGQGSLLHPGYSGVTLALLHGSSPDGMILVHRAGQDVIDEYDLPLPPLDRLVRIYEEAASWIKPAPVVGVALNTQWLDDSEARRTIVEAEAVTGLPTTDPLRYDAGILVDACVERLAGQLARS